LVVAALETMEMQETVEVVVDQVVRLDFLPV
jgi:hypothetical protein